MAVVVRPPNKCILCAQANKTESSIWCRHKMQYKVWKGIYSPSTNTFIFYENEEESYQSVLPLLKPSETEFSWMKICWLRV